MEPPVRVPVRVPGREELGPRLGWTVSYRVSGPTTVLLQELQGYSTDALSFFDFSFR